MSPDQVSPEQGDALIKTAEAIAHGYLRSIADGNVSHRAFYSPNRQAPDMVLVHSSDPNNAHGKTLFVYTKDPHTGDLCEGEAIQLGEGCRVTYSGTDGTITGEAAAAKVYQQLESIRRQRVLSFTI